MNDAEHWLEAFSLAELPAFSCRRTADGVQILSRTMQFVCVLESRADGLNESTLVDRLASAWPDHTDSPHFVVQGAGMPLWQCVIRPLADPVAAEEPTAASHIAILRMPTATQIRNDADFALVDSLPDIVSRYDRNLRHLYVNQVLDEVTAPITAQVHIGKDHWELGMGHDMTTLIQSVYRTVFATGQSVQQDFEYPAEQGPRHFVFRVVPEYGPDGEIRTILNTARDITELKALQRELETLARADSLTGLLNRRSFTDRAAAELARTRRTRAPLSLLLLDIDDFKAVNDRFGHRAGDSVLEAIGDVVRDEIQLCDFAGRIGGDEFCIALVDTDLDAAELTADRIRRRVCELDESYGCVTGVRVSVGMTAADPQDCSVSDLITRADRSMYGDKSANRSRRWRADSR